MLDQFYWAERMCWLGVSSEPLHRNHLLPDKNDARSVQEAAHAVSSAIHNALLPKVKARAVEIAKRISPEVMSFRRVGRMKLRTSVFGSFVVCSTYFILSFYII